MAPVSKKNKTKAEIQEELTVAQEELVAQREAAIRAISDRDQATEARDQIATQLKNLQIKYSQLEESRGAAAPAPESEDMTAHAKRLTELAGEAAKMSRAALLPFPEHEHIGRYEAFAQVAGIVLTDVARALRGEEK